MVRQIESRQPSDLERQTANQASPLSPLRTFIHKNWKKLLMAVVIAGAVVCMILSFVDEKNIQYIVGVLSGLTVIVPAVIWYSDGKDNEARDKKIDDHDKSLTWDKL